MDKKIKIKDIFITLMIIAVCFILCLMLQIFFGEDNALIPAIFVLGVFLSSVITQGYFCGVCAALISVLAVNFAFTFPFFRFDFTIPENFISAVILLIVTVVTCGLTTKIKRQEAMREESEREIMRANLLRAVSHDLKTPLTTICGSSSALSENYDDFTDEQRRQMIRGIAEDSQWMSRMTENLLSVTRLDGDNVEIIKTNTALDELIDSVLVKFAKRYPNITVSVDIPDEFVFIPIDALLIEQVILNILENSAEHAVGMTKLSIMVNAVSDRVIFEIRDDGCGIPREKMKNLFSGCYSEEFTRSDNRKNHTGIGLSVCASIIKAHGGEIKAQNLKDGGCLFCFVLNREEADEN